MDRGDTERICAIRRGELEQVYRLRLGAVERLHPLRGHRQSRPQVDWHQRRTVRIRRSPLALLHYQEFENTAQYSPLSCHRQGECEVDWHVGGALPFRWGELEDLQHRQLPHPGQPDKRPSLRPRGASMDGHRGRCGGVRLQRPLGHLPRWRPAAKVHVPKCHHRPNGQHLVWHGRQGTLVPVGLPNAETGACRGGGKQRKSRKPRAFGSF